jgi:hypothetical protein
LENKKTFAVADEGVRASPQKPVALFYCGSFLSASAASTNTGRHIGAGSTRCFPDA